MTLVRAQRWLFATALSLGFAGSTIWAQAPAEAPTPARQARTIVLLRHGHYAADPKADPVLGPGLSPIGVAQARLAGGRLRGADRFDAVLASPLIRARETARVVAEDLESKIEIVDALAECTPPTWRAVAVKDEKPEDMAACAQKLDVFFAEHFQPVEGDAARRELLVCHGNVIRYLVTKALKVDTMAWLGMSVHHASLTEIRVEPDGFFKIIAVGDSGHLPPNLLTGAAGDPDRSLAVPAGR